MTTFFIRLFTFFRDHRPIYWLSMAALFLFFGYFAMQIHLEEDIDKLMPSSKNEDGTTKLAFADLKIKDKVFLLFEAKSNLSSLTSDLSSVCDQFADSLQKDSTLIEDIFYQLDEDLMPEGIDYLTEHLPSYIQPAAYAAFDTLLTAEHMKAQMLQNREDLESEFGEMFPDLIQLDPIGMQQPAALF